MKPSTGTRISLIGATKVDGVTTFTPAKITGKGITTVSITVDIANLEFTGITDTGIPSAALYVSSGSIANVSCVTVYDVNVSYGAILILGTGNFYNVTVGNNCITTNATSAPFLVMSANASATLEHCTIATTNAKNFLKPSGTVTLKNVLFDVDPGVSGLSGYVVSNAITWTTSENGLPHYALAASSGALNSGGETTNLTYDALGNNRLSGSALDAGAIESQEAVAVVIPEDLAILPSGQRQVYFGWSPIEVANAYKVEKSTDGTQWTTLENTELLWTDVDSLENTVSGWQSVRYLAATPGETASYRLAASADNGETWVYSEAVSVTNPKPIVELHSRPSAKKTIYLDFNGHIDDYEPHVVMMQKTFETSYSTLAEKNYIEIQPFFFRGAYYNIEKSAMEVYDLSQAVEDIWRMVAEDFAIFDVNVTTVEPSYDALVKSSEEDDVYGKRVILDPAYDTTADNTRIWYPGAGGQSCLSSFGFRADRPVYVFGSASRQAIASQTTHEVGHTFGLTHDSGTIYFGEVFSSTAYYQGVAFTENATMKWYPVLGAVPSPGSYNGYFYDSGDFINQFSNGNYSSATNIEDDFAVILGLVKGDAEDTVVIDTKADLYPIDTRNLTLVEDEAGDTQETALLLSDDSIIGASSHTRTGVIGKHIVDFTTKNDVDCYTFALASAGTLSVSVIPSFDGYEEGASLDAGVELLNAQGAVLYRSESGTATADIRHATLTNLSLAAGTYTVRVYGTYHPVELAVVPEDSIETKWYPNATSNYGSVGPYSLQLNLKNTTFTTPYFSLGYLLRLK
ncbi:MAG: PPC domain-containing protein [bacterium]|nr:PPC domain-containing protein [bacterium]